MRIRARRIPNYTHEKTIRIVILIVSLLVVLIAWWNKRLLYRLEHLGYLGLFLVNIFANATVFLPVPSFLTVFVSGAIWNPYYVGIISGIGSAIGELVGFFIGFGGRGVINNLDGRKKIWLRKIELWFKRSGFVTIFIAAALPDPIFDLVGISAGTLNYPVWKFFLATTLGRILRNIIIAWTGAKIIP